MAPKAKSTNGKKDIKKSRKGHKTHKTLLMTINLHKACHGVTFKKRAPRAIKVIRHTAKKFLRTRDVRLDTPVNTFIWSKGIRNPPRRIRVQMERKKSEDEDAKDKYFVFVKHVPVKTFHDLQTRKLKKPKY